MEYLALLYNRNSLFLVHFSALLPGDQHKWPLSIVKGEKQAKSLGQIYTKYC